MKKIVLIILLLTNQSWAGHENGHGGDAIAASFVSTAYEVLTDLYSDPIVEIDAKKLALAISKTSVRSSEKKLIDSSTRAQVDAINHPDKKLPEIVVSRSRWNSNKDEYKKRRLVLHEYLNIMRINDKRYEVSSLIDRARICEHDLRYIYEKAFGGISCDRIPLKKLKGLTSLDLKDFTNELNSKQLSHLDLSKSNLILNDSIKLDDLLAKQLKYLTTNLREITKQDISRFENLKRLELKLFTDLDTPFISKLKKLDELILVSSLKTKIVLKRNFFLGTKLKRLVLCDTGEVIKNDYIKIPNIESEEGALNGLSSVKEGTFCFKTSNKKALNSNLLSGLINVEKLWIKFDDWSLVPKSIFQKIPKNTKIALMPSGKVFKDSIKSRFTGLVCNESTRWAKNQKKISGKIYCVKMN